jgi:hypothetical protein
VTFLCDRLPRFVSGPSGGLTRSPPFFGGLRRANPLYKATNQSSIAA